ncbi:hypothetical protein ASPSYDRAFT_439518 [Aspergillus sydowii CBS 593.65]|uniref:NACHT-NTPase and P-loop NTPases N-terminal domain-containing protein n=1 Tax=Aspergillus sydowii CBS 593.65 TaxID=1036612 RepID=A0A1L9T6M5_9EURO|nr:uncharacterized protein ASPSYDRAFT_439518 [Aspergillus sydowii CBS 593.65]OJJ55021.1 hypothetical protein ASPSYDRAFT_439518 [Aspergillus sydowii CBS 593.65]
MAEVIGVVSGAVTFAAVVVQVGNSITTLRDCWDQINDAPEDLRKLLQELELFSLILTDIEEDLSQSPILTNLNNSKYMLQCLTLCKEAAQDLEALCNDIVRDMKPASRLRLSYKSAKIVMRKGKIDKHMSRLQKVIRLLMLSQQSYTRALIQVQPQLIVERIRQHEPGCPEMASSTTVVSLEDTKACTNQTASCTPKRQCRDFPYHRECIWRLSLPLWMTSKVIEVAGTRAPSGWNWMLRTYSVIPRESAAVLCAVSGNIQGLQDLFAARQASPFDRVGDTDQTLLHFVGRKNRKEIIELLLSEGADPNSSDRLPVCSRVVPTSDRTRERETPSVLASMRVLLQRIEVNYETAEDAVEYVLSDFLGTPEEFTVLQQHFCPSFYQLPKLDRIKLALRVVHEYFLPHLEPGLIRTIIGMDDLAAIDINEIHFSWTTTTLIHSTAFRVGLCQGDLQVSDPTRGARQAFDSYGDLLRELLRLGADVHAVVDGMTPLLAFLEGYFSVSTLPKFEDRNNACNSAIQTWLGNLEAVGIDLAAYGETEQYNWMNKAPRREFSAWNIEELCHDTRRVIGFAYGPSPKDWHMWLAEASDRFVGEFWDMIERPVEEMPGSWPEK